ncbi:hypothetical protein B296_00042271 [Ensete ventricosum]|uniref:Uncharacterized protein n=1 Tax=Ensete ventricosum TaxID=4639 RepID=A0A426Y6I8_ENSVE|nr:hypothetical protein B296_00042271 [Ensete ventricosum]
MLFRLWMRQRHDLGDDTSVSLTEKLPVLLVPHQHIVIHFVFFFGYSVVYHQHLQWMDHLHNNHLPEQGDSVDGSRKRSLKVHLRKQSFLLDRSHCCEGRNQLGPGQINQDTVGCLGL